MLSASFRSLNPGRWISSRPAPYEKLPEHDGANGAAGFYPKQKGRFSFTSGATQRFRSGKLSFRVAIAAIALIVVVVFWGFRSPEEVDTTAEDETSAEEHANTRYWEVFPR